MPTVLQLITLVSSAPGRQLMLQSPGRLISATHGIAIDWLARATPSV